MLAASADVFSWPAIDERSAAAMCYTSGTTGNPKGVVYSHRSAYLHSIGVCLGNTFSVAEPDKILPMVPMFHANAWGLAYAAVFAGADLVMPDRFLQPAAIISLIDSQDVTVAGGVPTLWTAILEEMRARRLSGVSGPSGGHLSSLRMGIGGGSAVPHALIEAYESELGVRLVQAWGMTETSPLGAVALPPGSALSSSGPSGSDAWAYRDSGGRLISTLEGRITGDDGVLLPSDGVAVGELEVRGPWVTASYYLDSSPEKFHDGWLRTGDVGSLDALGYIRLTDRSKDVIKSGGEWISSMELENHLMAHPSVLEAAVIGVPDERWGERPLAAVVLRSPASASVSPSGSPGELRAFLADRVTRWQIPEYWTFIEQVPRTSVGKFNKRAMRDAYADGSYKVIECR
jgi:fatty-acyl-CoA synthase